MSAFNLSNMVAAAAVGATVMYGVSASARHTNGLGDGWVRPSVLAHTSANTRSRWFPINKHASSIIPTAKNHGTDIAGSDPTVQAYFAPSQYSGDKGKPS